MVLIALSTLVSCAAKTMVCSDSFLSRNASYQSDEGILKWSGSSMVCTAQSKRLHCKILASDHSWDWDAPTSILQIQGGAGYVCILDHDGGVWCTSNPTDAEFVSVTYGWARYAQISVKAWHVCALDKDSRQRVDCWKVRRKHSAYNFESHRSYGIGLTCDMVSTYISLYMILCDGGVWDADMIVSDNDAVNVLAPRMISGQIVGGLDSICGISHDFLVWCWGAGHTGGRGVQIANDLTALWHVSNVVVGPSGVDNIIGGANHFCAWKSHGDAWCWGIRESHRIISVEGKVLYHHTYDEFEESAKVVKIVGEVLSIETDGRTVTITVASPIFSIE